VNRMLRVTWFGWESQGHCAGAVTCEGGLGFSSGDRTFPDLIHGENRLITSTSTSRFIKESKATNLHMGRSLDRPFFWCVQAEYTVGVY
jgi:hypothetical protein